MMQLKNLSSFNNFSKNIIFYTLAIFENIEKKFLQKNQNVFNLYNPLTVRIRNTSTF